MRKRNIDPPRAAAAAFGVLFLLGVATQSAHANTEYDGSSLDGNLQHQCTGFSATRVAGTSLTVSAQCNKEGDTPGSVAAAQQTTSFDLSGEVVWNTQTQAFTWDGAPNDNNNITEKCKTVLGFGYSATDVTLQLTCTVASNDGSVQSVNADLALNSKLTVGTDGNLARR